MSKKGEANLYNVSILSFSRAVLLMGMGARDMVGDANVFKK